MNVSGPYADRVSYLVPSGYKVASHDRLSSSLVDLGTTVLTSGTLRLVAMVLAPGLTITKLAFVSGATALSGGSNQWACLLDNTYKTLAISADATSGTWAANALKSFTMSSSYQIKTAPGIYYAGLMVNATTPPSLIGTTDVNSVVALLSAAVTGNSSSGLTTPVSLPSPASAPSGAAAAVNKPFVLLG